MQAAFASKNQYLNQYQKRRRRQIYRHLSYTTPTHAKEGAVCSLIEVFEVVADHLVNFFLGHGGALNAKCLGAYLDDEVTPG